MVSAVVLFSVERDQINSVAEQLAGMPGVSEVYSVAGRYDLVAVLRVKTNDDLADLVTARIRKLKGILNTETLIAFRAYSRHDLEAMFDLGGKK
ncbi:MAG TPA: Lrp/AsnC ligand binding domain-containing protein [Gemmatimonadales bacterium]|nr:Lrp/AsnC ligand binding domain-containing protein [Gemmatimonadales bacterium]